MKYQLIEGGNCVQRLDDGAFIPFAQGNRDFAEYLAWCAAGNTPLPIPTPSPNAVIQAQIDEIERTTGVVRVVREFMLASAVLLAQQQAAALTSAGTPTTADQILANDIAYGRVKAVNEQIAYLRSQLK